MCTFKVFWVYFGCIENIVSSRFGLGSFPGSLDKYTDISEFTIRSHFLWLGCIVLVFGFFGGGVGDSLGLVA